MKNKLFPLFILSVLIFFGCHSSKIFENSILRINSNGIDSLVDGEYINVKLNGTRTLKLKFDTGAEISTINDIDLIGGEKVLNEQNHTKQKVGSAIKIFKAIAYKTKSFDSNISKSQNLKVVVYTNPKINVPCLQKLMGNDGLFGLNAYSAAENLKPILLDYEKGIIKVLSDEIKMPIGYSKVDAFFKEDQIYLNSLINGKKIKLLFDTGSNLFLILNKNIFDSKNNGNARILESINFVANNRILPNESLVVQDAEIIIEGLSIENSLIMVSEKYRRDVAGLPLIENYNWIIDFENQALYAKKIRSFDSNEFFEFLDPIQNIVLAINDKLVVLYSKGKYQVGDIITSVNSKKITVDNLCEMQKMLNENREDWSGFEIKSISLKSIEQ